MRLDYIAMVSHEWSHVIRQLSFINFFSRGNVFSLNYLNLYGVIFRWDTLCSLSTESKA